ncbi:MAG TPA: hypothetical protein DCX06_10090 [Opitutae bacterium]|nr:hypothetical protein [Opitutae bacterium]
MDTNRPNRKHPSRLELLDKGNRSNIIFVTVCTKQRTPQLNNLEFQQALINAWDTSDHWKVGKYMIMPDHIHFFCSPNSHPPSSLRNWIKFWKRKTSQEIGRTNHSSLWQTDCWDRQVRNGSAYTEKWAYVLQNPVRAGLVSNSDEWPYQGELNSLVWHD